MSDIILYVLILCGLIVIILPLTYLWHFFMEHLPRKYGHMKFILIVTCYLSILALGSFLLSEGVIGLMIFFTIPVMILLLGAWLLKDEIRHQLKWELNGIIDYYER
jgi:drug/metabolite transporter (DMT)-like permease